MIEHSEQWQWILDALNALSDWKTFGDATSLMLVAAAIADWLPHIAAMFSLIWVLIRIYETDTVQNFIYGRAKRYKEHHDNT